MMVISKIFCFAFLCKQQQKGYMNEFYSITAWTGQVCAICTDPAMLGCHSGLQALGNTKLLYDTNK